LANLCYIVDDDRATCRVISLGLRALGMQSEHFYDVPSMMAGLEQRVPDLILLDVSLGESDAIEAIRALSSACMTGTVHLMSGHDAALLEDVRLVGERHGLRMGQILKKPFRMDALKQVVDTERQRGDATGTPIPKPGAAAGPPSAPSIDLREALNKNWVDIWYQPKLDLYRSLVVGAEGLARVRHPEHGIMLPASFIPNAKKEDLIRLAEQALRVAMRDTAEFAVAGYNLRLAVNVPVHALVSLPIGSIVRECRRGQKSE
jgi:CheY-like chemotaxis protein